MLQFTAVKDYALARSGGWFTLTEAAAATGAPEPSVSARLRDLRKVGFRVSKRKIWATNRYLYQVTPS